MRHLGEGRFEAFSAGTHPRPAVHPQALATLRRNSVPVEGLSPKDAATFAGQPFDFVITVCDRAREQCPVMPGAEMIHWSFPDPAEEGEEKLERAFEAVFRGLEKRVRLLVTVESK